MESWRSPLASIPPFRRASWEDTAQRSGGWWNRQPLKLRLISKGNQVGWSPIQTPFTKGAGAPSVHCVPRPCRLGIKQRLIAKWENKTGYEKNLESTPRQVFQQAAVPGHKAGSVSPPGRGSSGLRPISTSGCAVRRARNRGKWDWSVLTSNNRTSEDWTFPMRSLVMWNLTLIEV